MLTSRFRGYLALVCLLGIATTRIYAEVKRCDSASLEKQIAESLGSRKAEVDVSEILEILRKIGTRESIQKHLNKLAKIKTAGISKILIVNDNDIVIEYRCLGDDVVLGVTVVCYFEKDSLVKVAAARFAESSR